jgi:secreted protein with Ig-like and vWFA domain
LDLTSTKGLNPFVGEGEPAVSTVFVIDVSGSMQNQAKLPRVMNALTRAIDQLSEKQKFCVLLFDQTYYSAPWVTGLTAGTADNKRRIKAWLAQPPGGGGTEPMGAMAAAIELRPERIVLLSDGEFDPTNILTITSMNHQLTTTARIDCVGLQEDVLVLREIANKNKGIYYQAW